MSPLPESLVRFRAELEDAIRRELEREPNARSNGWGGRVLRAVRRRPGRTTLAFAAVAGAAAAALFVSSPWKTPPGFLEQVQAALRPQAGKVLHLKVVVTENRGAGCEVTHPPVEYWIDLTPPYNWRAVDFKPAADICEAGISSEIGGKAASPTTALVFRPPNRLAATREWPNLTEADRDQWGEYLRQAIEDGTAHDEGSTFIDGRPVQHVRIDCNHAKFPPCAPIDAYVDRETYLPVRTVAGGIFFQDFLEYEYLPGTPANRALADIRAQHPNASGP